jgi:hypothetical protein
MGTPARPSTAGPARSTPATAKRAPPGSAKGKGKATPAPAAVPPRVLPVAREVRERHAACSASCAIGH